MILGREEDLDFFMTMTRRDHKPRYGEYQGNIGVAKGGDRACLIAIPRHHSGPGPETLQVVAILCLDIFSMV